MGWGQWLGRSLGSLWVDAQPSVWGWVERWGLSCQNALNCTLPSTINSCNLHLNELDSVNLALPCLSGLKAMGPRHLPHLLGVSPQLVVTGKQAAEEEGGGQQGPRSKRRGRGNAVGDDNWGCEVDGVPATWPSVTGQSMSWSLELHGRKVRCALGWNTLSASQPPCDFTPISHSDHSLPPPPTFSAPRPPSQSKPFLCFGVGLSPQCRLMPRMLPGGPPVVGVGLAGTWPHLLILPVPVSSSFRLHALNPPQPLARVMPPVSESAPWCGSPISPSAPRSMWARLRGSLPQQPVVLAHPSRCWTNTMEEGVPRLSCLI